MAAILVAAWALASPGFALASDEPGEHGFSVSWGAPGEFALPHRYGQAGTTAHPGRGWTTSVFVTSFASRPSIGDDGLRVRSASFVNGRITRKLSKNLRVSLDVLNVFDKRVAEGDHFSPTRLWSTPGAADNFLFHPVESRGFRLRLRATF
jgi:outer membrane receptor protein involved in Fe transport